MGSGLNQRIEKSVFRPVKRVSVARRRVYKAESGKMKAETDKQEKSRDRVREACSLE
jgi:hypothetical protein